MKNLNLPILSQNFQNPKFCLMNTTPFSIVKQFGGFYKIFQFLSSSMKSCERISTLQSKDIELFSV